MTHSNYYRYKCNEFFSGLLRDFAGQARIWTPNLSTPSALPPVKNSGHLIWTMSCDGAFIQHFPLRYLKKFADFCLNRQRNHALSKDE